MSEEASPDTTVLATPVPTDEKENSTPPNVAKTVEILKGAAQATGAPKLDATIAAINVAAQHHAATTPKGS